MGFHFLDGEKDGPDDVVEGYQEPDSSIESPWLRKIDGDLQNTRRFQEGKHVLVRCNKGSWLRGWIKRHTKNGVGVLLAVSETMVSIPWELVSTHLMRLENYASGAIDSFYVRVHYVRPSHLFHRHLYERAVIVPYKSLFEGAVNRDPNPEEPTVFTASDDLTSCLNRDTFYPRRPNSSGTVVTSKGFEAKILKETNPLCCGILKHSVGAVERKVDEGRALCPSQESDVEYVSAYDEVQDPEDENTMGQIRANLYQKFLARRRTLETSTYPDDNIPSSSASASPRSKTGWSLESARLYLASKRDSLLFPDRQMPPGVPTESTPCSDPYAKEDASEHLFNGFYPSKPRIHSELHSMVELGSRSETEASFGGRMTMISL